MKWLLLLVMCVLLASALGGRRKVLGSRRNGDPKDEETKRKLDGENDRRKEVPDEQPAEEQTAGGGRRKVVKRLGGENGRRNAGTDEQPEEASLLNTEVKMECPWTETKDWVRMAGERSIYHESAGMLSCEENVMAIKSVRSEDAENTMENALVIYSYGSGKTGKIAVRVDSTCFVTDSSNALASMKDEIEDRNTSGTYQQKPMTIVLRASSRACDLSDQPAVQKYCEGADVYETTRSMYYGGIDGDLTKVPMLYLMAALRHPAKPLAPCGDSDARRDDKLQIAKLASRVGRNGSRGGSRGGGRAGRRKG